MTCDEGARFEPGRPDQETQGNPAGRSHRPWPSLGPCLRIWAAVALLAGCDFEHGPLDQQAQAYRLAAAQVPIGARCLVVGDSNVVVPAQQLVDAAQRPPDPQRPAIVLDFAAAIPGVGLRDLELLTARVTDPRVQGFPYDCTIVNLGLNDAFAEREHFDAFFLGIAHGLTYTERVDALLRVLPDAPIYWVGIPDGATAGAASPVSIAAINLELGCFELPFPGFCDATHPMDARMRYVDPELSLGEIEDRFRDGVHYNEDAAAALFGALLERIAEDLVAT